MHLLTDEERKTLTGAFVVWAPLICTRQKQPVNRGSVILFQTATRKSVYSYVCVAASVFTLADCGCKVLQEGVIKQLGKVVQDEGEAWFGIIRTHYAFKLLLVGLTSCVVLNPQTAHLPTSHSCSGVVGSGPNVFIIHPFGGCHSPGYFYRTGR